MKNEKWIKFINEVIPNLEDQDVLSDFVKKSYYGESYGKALLFYGEGCNGKSAMVNVLKEIVGAKPFRKNFATFAQYPEEDKSELYKRAISERGINIIFASNKNPKIEGIHRRCHVIFFPAIIQNPNPNLVSELCEELDGIKEWFGIC